MEIKSLDEIIESLENKNLEIQNKIEQIKSMKKEKLNMNYENLDLLLKINDNLDLANDKLDDINIEILQQQDINELNYEQKELLKEHKFQQIFKKTLLPYVIYLRLCLET